jgi:predicted AAA+ superfamily ATPase
VYCLEDFCGSWVFFSLTVPTYNLRHLVCDVVLRVAGKNDKAVRQLEVTYGGVLTTKARRLEANR